MALQSYGTVGPFDRSKEEWTSYCERVELPLAANALENAEQRRAVLLSVCGAQTYQLIRSLVAPLKPTDKSFVQLVKAHLQPPPSSIMQRYTFNARCQKDGESVAEYVAELRHIAEHCDFGQSLEHMLRDRLVCGLKDSRLQRRLLAEPTLTFVKALELAQASELAEQGARVLQPQPPPSVEINKVSGMSQSSNRSAVSCFRCGGRHLGSSCRCKDWVCRACGKLGHIAKVCKSKGDKQVAGKPQKGKFKGSRSGPSSVPEREVHTLFLVRRKSSNPPLTICVIVDGANVEFEVDTGAAVSLISQAKFNDAWPPLQRPRLRRTDVVLRTYTGEKLPVLGQIQANVIFRDKTISSSGSCKGRWTYADGQRLDRKAGGGTTAVTSAVHQINSSRSVSDAVKIRRSVPRRVGSRERPESKTTCRHFVQTAVFQAPTRSPRSEEKVGT